MAACDRAFHSYEPGPCAAPIALVRSAQMVRWTRDLPLDWSGYTADLRTWEVDGLHRALLTGPTVGQVARIITEELAGSNRPD